MYHRVQVTNPSLQVHQHNHPHVLLLQVSNTWKLPGGRLRPGEDGALDFASSLQLHRHQALLASVTHHEQLACKTIRGCVLQKLKGSSAS